MKRCGLLLLFFFFFYSYAQGYLFRNYQMEDGLSHNSVWAVMQDRKGFMWFGTAEGLNRFDGKTFKIYKKQHKDSLSIGSNFIHNLKEDSQGRLLVGTKQGLYLFDTNREIFRHIKLNNDRVDNTSISHIMEDPDGNIWLACYGQGIYMLSPDLKVKKHYRNRNGANEIPSNFIWTMVQDYNGVIWLGSDGKGLIRFDPKEEKFISIAGDKKIGIDAPIVYSLYCDIDNTIWIGTSGSGLYSYNYRNGKTARYTNQKGRKIFNIKAITAFSDHELIMGSDNGLVKFNRNQKSFYLLNDGSSFDNLTDKSIFSIVKDREGAFWIGTYFGGVNYYSPDINRFSYYSNVHNNSNKKNIVSSFTQNENGKVWVGTHDSGVSLFDPGTSKFKNVQYDIGYHDVQKLLLDNDKLYISLYGKGVKILNTVNGSISNYLYDTANSSANFLTNNFINTLFKSSRGIIYFGMAEGASYIDASGKKPKKIDHLSSIPIKDIEEDYNGSLWFASHKNGLLRLSADGKWDSFTHDPNDSTTLVSDNVNCIFQDTKYHLWIGTEGNGLTMLNLKTGKFELLLDEKSGLPSNIIYSILDDADGNIWISTSGGLAKIDPVTTAIKTFGYMEAIQKIRYNPDCALRAFDNQLYFGGTNGFTVFNPREIIDHLDKPNIVITGFQVFNKEVIPGAESSPLHISINNTKEITLAYNQSTFSFDFVALSYISSTQNHYAYKLEGFDKEWNQAGNNNKALYMNIPAGEYIFRVKAFSKDGLWADTETRISISVQRPFWLSNIMIALYIILIILIGSYLIYINNKRVKKENKEKIYKYKIAKEKEIFESKINFFTNIAHEIRTPLSLIVAPLENIIVSDDGNTQTKGNLKIIKRNANRLLELVNQLLDFRKIEEDMFPFTMRMQNVTGIVREVYKQYFQNVERRHIDVQLIVDQEEIVALVDAEAIYKIISNLISNAIKYAKSKIIIKIESIENEFILTVEDDGIGIENEYLDKIFEPFFQIEHTNAVMKTGSGLGLSLSQSLARKHGGAISVKSGQKGCLFTLRIPIIASDDIIWEKEAIADDYYAESQQTCVSEARQRILLVEDNQELRVFLSNSLAESFSVFEAENGIKALEILEKENIDIIISDILMPGMDGMELCHAIKTNPAYSHIPLIFLSAKTDTSTKVEGLKKGADIYIEKPFSMEQMKAQLNSIIENRNHMRDNFIKSPLQYFKQNAKNTENSDFIEKLNGIILEHVSDEQFSIDHLSEQFSMSRSNFHKKIKNITGITPNDYIKLIRLNLSAQMLSTGKYKINEVCYLVGFNTPSYFSKCFYEQFGKLPKDFVQTLTDQPMS